jgi:glycosyltransferase involved in cell wall biosynthesis
VLTTRCGALPEVGGDAVLYVDPLDQEAIADGLTQILTDTELRATLRTRGLARAPEFKWEETARRTLDAYRRAL